MIIKINITLIFYVLFFISTRHFDNIVPQAPLLADPPKLPTQSLFVLWLLHLMSRLSEHILTSWCSGPCIFPMEQLIISALNTEHIICILS